MGMMVLTMPAVPLDLDEHKIYVLRRDFFDYFSAALFHNNSYCFYDFRFWIEPIQSLRQQPGRCSSSRSRQDTVPCSYCDWPDGILPHDPGSRIFLVRRGKTSARESHILRPLKDQMTEPSFAAVDFEEVLNRLVLYAQSLSAAMVCAGLQERILPGGESAEDLAMATLLKFVDPLNTSVKWSEQKAEPTTATVLAYLRKVLERDFLDLKKSKRYRTTVYVDAYGDDEDEAGITLEQLAKMFETPEGEAQRRQQVEWVLKQFDLEPEL